MFRWLGLILGNGWAGGAGEVNYSKFKSVVQIKLLRSWLVLMQKVVINSSPLIVLFKSQLINILPQVCQEIIIPNPVCSEVTAYSLEKLFDFD